MALDSGRLGYIDSPKSLTFESEVFVALVPVSQRDYARPELLTETEWLAQHLNNPKVRIIDARSPQQYSAGHIPGAVNLTGFTAIPRAANQDMAAPEEFNPGAGNLGLSNQLTEVGFDNPPPEMRV